MPELKPGPELEKAFIAINNTFKQVGGRYWHCFGGLWGLACNQGIIPDGDLDICAFYPTDWEHLANAFAGQGFERSKVLLDDQTGKALFMGVENKNLGIYICISFWYRWREYYFWCHDEKQDLQPKEIGSPKSGYFFKGCPSRLLDHDSKFMEVEWPGISGRTRVSVPMLSGEILDICYPGWPYRIQRYDPQQYQYQFDKTVSVNDPIYNKGVNIHAISPYRVEVQSMKCFEDETKIRRLIDDSRCKYETMLQKRYPK